MRKKIEETLAMLKTQEKEAEAKHNANKKKLEKFPKWASSPSLPQLINFGRIHEELYEGKYNWILKTFAVSILTCLGPRSRM